MRRAALLVAALLASCGDDDEPSEIRVQADQAMGALAPMYTEGIGLFAFNWWTSANAIETTIDYTRITGDDQYLWMVENTFELNKVANVNQDDNFINQLYDDEGWWALAWLDAHDLTGEARYLDMAEVIFDDMTGGWDDVCGGGVWWSKERAYKNAITNELFLEIAARLYQRTDDDAYLDWAEQEWEWLAATGMLNQDSLFNDGLTADCQNNGQTTWTYNQGVILGGLVTLADITGDQALLDQARAIADAALDSVLVNQAGVLIEPCEPDCGRDGPQFKGIFMRNLSELEQVTGDPAYREFAARQAESIRERATTELGEIGLMWYGPFDEAEPTRQSSGLDAINAALLALSAESG